MVRITDDANKGGNPTPMEQHGNLIAIVESQTFFPELSWVETNEVVVIDRLACPVAADVRSVSRSILVHLSIRLVWVVVMRTLTVDTLPVESGQARQMRKGTTKSRGREHD